MIEDISLIRDKFREKGFKATPQRIAVYRALHKLGHACVDEIVADVHKHSPTITVGTIYNVLDCFVQNGIIARMNTSDNKMYFDINTTEHHHLYCEKDNKIEDFYDDGLVDVIRNYLKDKRIEGFQLSDVKVQLMGHFLNK